VYCHDDDDIDDADDFGYQVEAMMINPHESPYDDEHVDVPDDLQEEIPGHYESNEIVNQLLEEIDSDAVNDLTEYDDTPVNNQTLLDDIFGIDSDDDSDVVTNVVDATDEPTVEVEPVAEPVLRTISQEGGIKGMSDLVLVSVMCCHVRTFLIRQY
jgi:hypothetical protein